MYGRNKSSSFWGDPLCLVLLLFYAKRTRSLEAASTYGNLERAGVLADRQIQKRDFGVTKELPEVFIFKSHVTLLIQDGNPSLSKERERERGKKHRR